MFFHEHQADKRYKHCKKYQQLCETVSLLYNVEETKSKQQIILGFWKSLYEARIETNKPGTTEFIQDPLKLLSPLLSLQPFYEETRTCYACGLEGKTRLRWPLLMKILEITQMRLKSVQEHFTWYVSNKHFKLCDICLSNQTEIVYQYNLEPNFIVLEFAPESNYLEFNQEMVNIETRSKFQLVATINQPTANHFNCGIYDPQTEGKKFQIKGWTLHDGLKNAGSLTKLINLNQLWRQRPFVLFY